MTSSSDVEGPAAKAERLGQQLDAAIGRLAETSGFAKSTRRGEAVDLARRLLLLPGGVDRLYPRAGALDRAGVFVGTDWDRPDVLLPTLASTTLREGDVHSAVLEGLSELRLLAVARGDFLHPSVSAEQAHKFLSQVLALNVNELAGASGTEADRVRSGPLGEARRDFYRYLASHIGYENIFDHLVDEMWRILSQRPISVDHVKQMVTQMAAQMYGGGGAEVVGANAGAARLVAALYGPTRGCQEDPGLDVYRDRLAAMDLHALRLEASGMARAMHDTGLVSPYHAVYLRFVLEREPTLIGPALGLSSTGRDGLLCYQLLVHRLIDEAIQPETAQAIYGLTMLLERGLLYTPPVAPSLWRQIGLRMAPETEQALTRAFGDGLPPRVVLLAGVLSVLGQPLGIGQGNNPTCQSARALSMWSLNDPDYLLQMLTWAARDGEVIMHFEGERISSREAGAGLAEAPPIDVDPVSVVLVPHLDRVYLEMGRKCAIRGGDPHEWVNPEFHGWWVGRGFALAVDVATGKLDDYEGFTRLFYAIYHPLHNGNMPVIHPQPAGVAVTDSAGRFVGWHAITILRVALDQHDEMRVYFFNPNNDSGQDWGRDVMVATEGSGERFGEGSLPIAEFASRLYLFHYDPLERGDLASVPAAEIARVTAMARDTWAAER
ncbi:MAG TPA: hypothetical protein RMF84_06805 [Polyangiaceae bacterium LLY-WYZ-14_1]|nr:hypothetical protein [Polyangiaceae bacterium LLY-WYZ-14_1]